MRSVIRPRREWTHKAIDRRCTRQNEAHPVLYVHYSDSPGRGLKTKAKQVAAVDAIREYHVNGNGWYDIGYSYICAQPWGFYPKARIWRGRGKGYVPASQDGHNTGSVSVCVIANGLESLKPQTITAIAALARELGCSRILGHKDVNATSCPGSAIYSALPKIRKQARL